MNIPKKNFNIYQKDRDKEKCKVGGLPNIKVTDNLPPPLVTTPTPRIYRLLKNVDTTHEDTNPESEILFTMNIDTQEVNIIVDKDITKIKNNIANNENIAEQPIENIEVGIQIEQAEQIVHTEKPLDNGINTGSVDAGIVKLTKIEILTIDNIEVPTEKLTDIQVHVEIAKPIIIERPKPLLVEMQTQIDPPEVDSSKLLLVLQALR